MRWSRRRWMKSQFDSVKYSPSHVCVTASKRITAGNSFEKPVWRDAVPNKWIGDSILYTTRKNENLQTHCTHISDRSQTINCMIQNNPVLPAPAPETTATEPKILQRIYKGTYLPHGWAHVSEFNSNSRFDVTSAAIFDCRGFSIRWRAAYAYMRWERDSRAWRISRSSPCASVLYESCTCTVE